MQSSTETHQNIYIILLHELGMGHLNNIMPADIKHPTL